MHGGIEGVMAALQSAGFERLPKPLVIGGTTFDLEAAAKGTGVSHDLVVVASGSAEPRGLVRLMSALSRTLDQVGSSRPVSLVLLGEPPDSPTMEDLGRFARILPPLADAPDADEIRQSIAALLPLDLPSAVTRGKDPLVEVTDFLGDAVSTEHLVLIAAAEGGPDQVREALRRYIDAAVQSEATGGAAS